jgi:methyl-accepting chemotaxis protein
MTSFATGISTVEDGASAGERAAGEALEALATDAADFVQVFASSRYDARAVLDSVRAVVGTETPLIGCTSTGEFTQAATVETGVAVAALSSETMRVRTALGTDIGDGVTGAVRDAMADLPQTESYPYQSALVLNDIKSGVTEQLIRTVRRKLGPRVSVAGGTASDNYALERTPVFHGGDIVEDALVIARIESERRVGVAVDHGHDPISESMTITESSGPVVAEIDDRPALDAYYDAIADRIQAQFGVGREVLLEDSELRTKILGEYEFGLDRGDGYSIRWPRIRDVEAGTLQFPVEMPEGTVVRVMHGAPDDQIDSARRVASEARSMIDGDPAGAFVYDCACREIILGDRFGEAVDAMNEALDSPFAGFETYGETCMRKGQRNGYHNTTTVVMVIPS